MHTSKEKQGINALLPIGKQVFSPPQKTRAPSNLMVTVESTITPNVAALLLLPTLYTEHDVVWSGISLWSVWVMCPGCVCSQPLMHLQLPLTVWQYKRQKRLWLWASPAQP